MYILYMNPKYKTKKLNSYTQGIDITEYSAYNNINKYCIITHN